ncbi:hypothetical protein [Paractinoplanes toevensis]|uniref:N-acetyltransferase domain-containing protein n=1 Tax=Paractinoplanes toevensis TaxID=571911 RepID=A0A919TB92_9ACTN|nr:hypothetical protein [Actinoplanes toevensis]GIM91872.1 hypothetical protein Ato02nite_036650 [Actinoplanes toevensis]
MTIRLDRVSNRAELREFRALPLRLHPADRYVPPADAMITGWWQAGVELYLARDATGAVVGRTCVHRDPRLDAKLGRRLQLFGLTEFTDDDAVAGALFRLIGERGRDTDALFGPVGLLPNQTGGVITSGFGERGFIDSAWNPAYYPKIFENHDFVRRFEADTWRCDLPATADPDVLFPFDDERLAAERLVLRYGSRRRFAEQLPILRSMLNASFAQRRYYTEIDAAELAAQTDGLAHLLDEKLLMWLEKDGRPVAFVVAVPDVSRFLMARRGDLGLVNQLRLLATRARYRDEAVLIIKGTVPGEQGKGYLTLLSRELFRNLAAGGYRTLRSTFVERDNPASAAQYPRMGGRPLHGYTFYQRETR